MIDDTYDKDTPIEVIPSFREKKSIVVLFLLAFVFRFGYLVVFGISWYLYEFYIALFCTLTSYIVLTIAFSKIRQEAICIDEIEQEFSDIDILHRFLYYRGFN